MVWWKQSAVRTGDGQITFEAPIELRCHWEDRREEVRVNTGAQSISTATVFIPAECFSDPTNVVKEGDFIDQLALEDLDASQKANPLSNQNAQAVLVASKNRDLNGAIMFWKVQL
jgi:hypothetical protein